MTRRALLVALWWLSTTLAATAQKTLTIFHINDTHSYVYPWGPKVAGTPQNGAAARLARRLNDLRSAAVNPVLLHGGDSFTGDLFFNRFLGRGEFELFNTMGMTAMALGNHDFDLRPVRLKNAIVQSNALFNILSANIRYNGDTSGLAQYVKPFVVETVGDVRVGIFGLTTTSTVFYRESTPITFDPIVPAARAMVDSLRARNVDVIVAVTHLGVTEDRQIAENVDGIDVIVGGHSHTPLHQPVLQQTPSGDTTIILQAGSKWEYLGMLTLTLDGPTKTWTYRLDRIAAPLPDDPAFTDALEGYRDSITATYGNVYADTVAMMTDELPPVNVAAGDLEVPLLNLVTDAYRIATNADVAFEVSALMRQNLYPGAISSAEIRQMLSWAYDSVQSLGKRLSIVEVTGATLRLILGATISFSFDFLGGGGGFFLAMQTSGLQYSVSGLGFFPVVRDVWVGNEPLEDTRLYRVVLNEFLADLAPQFPLIHFLSRKDTSIGSDAALAQYLRSLGRFDGRAIRMGRVWDESRLSPLTMDIDREELRIRWNAKAGVSAYNIERKRAGSSEPFVRLNAAPIIAAEFRDKGVVRGESNYYRLEEVRQNGLRHVQIPVLHKVGGTPASAYLRQNFPNPFAGAHEHTKIVFGIPEPSLVSVILYDLLGRKVRTLLEAERDAGEYEVVWDGSNAAGEQTASGVYIVRLTTSLFQDIKRVVLAK
jgi:5'-nucleotidase/UDP-sugar diphosphatase